MSSTAENEILEAPNVAEVPIYSPLRYPGGKSRYYTIASKWIASIAPEVLIEPFAGGAHIGLAAAIRGWVDKVVLVEIDENVAAVWKTILDGEDEWLIKQIRGFDMTPENVKDVLERKDRSDRDRAFAMIVHNRISRGGITAPGSGRLNKGEDGNGIKSRWYRDTLIDRMQSIAKVRGSIEFIEGDGFETIEEYSEDPGCSLFIDPPYPSVGRRLYTHSDVDPDKVFRKAGGCNGDVLITYAESPEICGLVDEYDFKSEKILLSTTHHTDKRELLISRDLDWLPKSL